jgi:hypothetical protein
MADVNGHDSPLRAVSLQIADEKVEKCWAKTAEWMVDCRRITADETYRAAERFMW